MGKWFDLSMSWNLHLDVDFSPEFNWQVHELLGCLDDIEPNQAESDSFVWLADCSEAFTVKSCYKLLLQAHQTEDLSA